MQNPPTHQNYSTSRGVKFHSRKILSFGFAHKDLGIKLITHLNLQGQLTRSVMSSSLSTPLPSMLGASSLKSSGLVDPTQYRCVLRYWQVFKFLPTDAFASL
jgi:hypothetical protein